MRFCAAIAARERPLDHLDCGRGDGVGGEVRSPVRVANGLRTSIWPNGNNATQFYAPQIIVFDQANGKQLARIVQP